MTTTSMSTAQLLAVYNKLATETSSPVLKAWKGSKDKLIEKIAFLRNKKAGKKADEPKDEPLKQTPRTGRTIREVSEELLLHAVEVRDGRRIGYTYEEILEKVIKEFGPNIDTTVACLRWYAVHLNKQSDVRMPVRPRKRVKRGKEKAAA